MTLKIRIHHKLAIYVFLLSLMFGGCLSVSIPFTEGDEEEPVRATFVDPEEPATTLGPPSSQAEYNLSYARQQFYLKNFSTAEFYLKKTLLEVPDEPTAIRLLPWSYFYQKQFDRALIAFSKANAHYPKETQPLVGMGWSYLSMGFYELAEKTFKRAEQLDAERYQVSKGKGFALLMLKKNEAGWKTLSHVFDEDEILQLRALWNKWQTENPNALPPVAPDTNHTVTLFTLPSEKPRYRSVLMGWAKLDESASLDSAWHLYRKKKFEEALEAFDALSGKHPEALDAKNGMAWTLLSSGNIHDARQMFHEILDSYPNFIGAEEGLNAVKVALQKKSDYARYYFDLKKYRIADEKFDVLADELPFWSYPYTMLGMIDLEEDREDEAVEHFDEALTRNPEDTLALEGMNRIEGLTVATLYQADQARTQGDIKKASYLYWDYIQNRASEEELDKPLSKAYNGLAWVQIEKRQYELAILNFQKIQDQDKFQYEATKGLGLAYYHSRDYGRALSYLADAESMREDKEVTHALNWSILHTHDPYQAEARLIRRVKRHPRQASTYMALGWVYYHAGNPDLGIEYFLKSISLEPKLAMTPEFVGMLDKERFGWEIYNRLGWEYYKRREYDHSLLLFQAAITREHGSSDALKGMGYTYYRQGKLGQAESRLRQSLAENKAPLPVKEVLNGRGIQAPIEYLSSPRTLLARIYLKKGRYQEALAQLQLVQKQNPDWPEVNDALGWAYLKLNRFNESRAAFNKSIRFQPLHPQSHKGLKELKHLMSTEQL